MCVCVPVCVCTHMCDCGWQTSPRSRRTITLPLSSIKACFLQHSKVRIPFNSSSGIFEQHVNFSILFLLNWGPPFCLLTTHSWLWYDRPQSQGRVSQSDWGQQGRDWCWFSSAPRTPPSWGGSSQRLQSTSAAEESHSWQPSSAAHRTHHLGTPRSSLGDSGSPEMTPGEGDFWLKDHSEKFIPIVQAGDMTAGPYSKLAQSIWLPTMPKVSNHFPDLLRVANSLDTAEVLQNVKARPSLCETHAHSLPSNRGGNGRALTWLHMPAMAAFQRLRQEDHHEF